MNDCSRAFASANYSPAGEAAVVQRLAQALFTVVPLRFATYCAFTARVLTGTLRRLGVAAELAPCQLWHAAHPENHVIGFLGREAHAGRWDGHVVCVTGSILVDAAVHNLQRDFQLDVPHIAIAPRFQTPSQVLARLDLDRDRTLWWHNPPPGACDRAPEEPMELVNSYVRELTDRLQA